jgi:hypothetical protein
MNENNTNKLIKRQKQSINLLINRPDFEKAILFLREKWNIPKNGTKNQEEFDQLSNNIPTKDLLDDIKKIVHDQKISPRWINGIKRYLLSNDPDGMALFLGPIITNKIDINSGLETISIEINEDTTIEDIKAIWSDVNNSQTRLLYKKRKKNQPIKNFERNKKAYDLHQQGKSLNEIADIFSNTEYNLKNKITIADVDIADWIRKYKKTIGIN